MNKLNPGIVNTVALLNAAGFRTTDSGDGETRDHHCDRAYGYVVVSVPMGGDIAHHAAQVVNLLRAHGVIVDDDEGHTHVQGLYLPIHGRGFVEIHHIHDRMLDSDSELDVARRELRLGALARYFPHQALPEKYYLGTIAGEPFMCGTTVCVLLSDMDEAYQRQHLSGRDYVPAAAVCRITLVETDGEPLQKCGCPDVGYGRGPACRAAKGFQFASDDSCNCACHGAGETLVPNG